MPFDPADSAFLDDPYPTFSALRAIAPVHEHPMLGMPVAVSHAACSEVLRGRSLGRIWADAQPAAEFPAFNLLHRNSLLEREGEPHDRLRTLVAGAFNRGHTARLEPAVSALADRLVAELAVQVRHTGSADLMAGVAHVLPVEVIAELLGLPESVRPRLPRLVDRDRRDVRTRPGRRTAGAGGDGVGGVRRRPARGDRPPPRAPRGRPGQRPGRGRPRRRADRLGADELVGTAALLLMAGHEATVNVIGNGVLALLRHRAQWRRLVADPVLSATAVEELIRFDPPLQLFERTALRDTTVAGHDVPAGTKVAALLGAAAHDPQVFDDPAELDVGRRPQPAPRVRRGGALLPGRAAGAAGGGGRAGCAAPPPAGDGARGTAAATAGLRHAGVAGAAAGCPDSRTVAAHGRRRAAGLRGARTGFEQHRQPAHEHRGDPCRDRGEQVQHRVQHDPVRPGLHAGAPRPDQRDRRRAHPRPPTAATTGRPAATAAAAGPVRGPARRARSRRAPGPPPRGSTRARPTPARSPATTATAASCCGPRPQRPRAATSHHDAARREAEQHRPRAGGEHQRVRRRDGVRRQRTLPAGQQQHVAPRLGAGREQRDGRQRPQQRARDGGERAGRVRSGRNRAHAGDASGSSHPRPRRCRKAPTLRLGVVRGADVAAGPRQWWLRDGRRGWFGHPLQRGEVAPAARAEGPPGGVGHVPAARAGHPGGGHGQSICGAPESATTSRPCADHACMPPSTFTAG